MPRQVRIEYEGAFYHVMARGNRRNSIFESADGADEELFLKTLGQCCRRTGFRIWAWVLMGNHLRTLMDYIHLNPVRAGLVRCEDNNVLLTLRRVTVAWSLVQKTSLRQAWIADRLSMRSADNVSTQVRAFAKKSAKELPPKIRKWVKRNQ